MRKAILGVFVGLLVLSVPACKTIQEPWAWMDEPENQVWIDMQIEVFGRTLQFSVPDSARRVGTNAFRTPHLEENLTDTEITVSMEYWTARATRITGFDWERYWGGYFKEDQRNFALSVWVEFLGEDANLLDQTVQQRQERITQAYSSRFQDNDYGRWKKGMFRVEPYTSSQGYVWTLENSPPRVREFEEFKIPLTDHHELSFNFYYRMNDEKRVNSEGWYDRRKALSRKILDTVRITPELKRN